jgi:hypothetical protein
MKNTNETLGLAASITKAASTQTYHTIRYLVDKDRVADAYRAYAYFRWVDDSLDAGSTTAPERNAFVERQNGKKRRVMQASTNRCLWIWSEMTTKRTAACKPICAI